MLKPPRRSVYYVDVGNWPGSLNQSYNCPHCGKDNTPYILKSTCIKCRKPLHMPRIQQLTFAEYFDIMAEQMELFQGNYVTSHDVQCDAQCDVQWEKRFKKAKKTWL